jgi:hypothetical protein
MLFDRRGQFAIQQTLKFLAMGKSIDSMPCIVYDAWQFINLFYQKYGIF